MMIEIKMFYVFMMIPIIGVIFSILSIIRKYLNDIIDLKRIDSFQNYETILEYYFEKSYTTIYKDQILVFSVEGLSPKEEDIKKIQHLYLDLFIKMCGEWLLEQFHTYYGDHSTLYFNALTYFDEHYEKDAIRSSAINKQLLQD